MSRILAFASVLSLSACIDPSTDTSDTSAATFGPALENGYDGAKEGTAAWANNIALPVVREEWAADAQLAMIDGIGVTSEGIIDLSNVNAHWSLQFTSESATTKTYSVDVYSDQVVDGSARISGINYFSDWFVDSDAMSSMMEAPRSPVLFSGVHAQQQFSSFLPSGTPDDLPIWFWSPDNDNPRYCFYSARDGSLLIPSDEEIRTITTENCPN